MRTGSSPAHSATLTLDNIEEMPAPAQLVVTRITAQELALKLRSGQLGPLKPCCYSPSSHTIKVLSMV